MTSEQERQTAQTALNTILTHHLPLPEWREDLSRMLTQPGELDERQQQTLAELNEARQEVDGMLRGPQENPQGA